MNISSFVSQSRYEYASSLDLDQSVIVTPVLFRRLMLYLQSIEWADGLDLKAPLVVSLTVLETKCPSLELNSSFPPSTQSITFSNEPSTDRL